MRALFRLPCQIRRRRPALQTAALQIRPLQRSLLVERHFDPDKKPDFRGLGRAVRQKVPGAWLFAGLILTYPTTYYFVFPHARYRHPIEPELVILALFLLLQTGKRKPAAGMNADYRNLR